LEKTCPSATFVHHKIPRAHPGLNPGLRGGKPATNRLSYDAAVLDYYEHIGFDVLTSVVMKSTTTALLTTRFYSGFLLGLFFNPKDGGDISQNVVLFIMAMVTFVNQLFTDVDISINAY
jgi:hypothetical protein